MNDPNDNARRAIQEASPSLSEAPPERFPSGPPEEASDRQGAYQPLSILAIAGLGIAVPYSLYVALGGLISWWVRAPFLLDGLTILIPLASTSLCLVAWMRIQRSEGTLGGKRLAVWGLGLSLFVGLGYWAYFMATYFATLHQADQYCRQWFEKVADGKLEQGFVMTLLPANRPREDLPNLKDELEKRFNTMNKAAPRGEFSQFRKHEIMRFLRQAGPDLKIDYLGSPSWEFKDGFQIKLKYRVTSPEGSFEIQTSLRGSDKQAAAGVRQWTVRWEETQIAGQPTLTKLGETNVKLRDQSKQFMEFWLRNMSMGNMDNSYFATLPPKERDQAMASYKQKIAALSSLAAVDVSSRGLPTGLLALAALYSEPKWIPNNLLPGYDKFLAGNLVELDMDRLIVPDKFTKEGFLKKVQSQFLDPRNDVALNVTLDRANVLFCTTDGDQFVVEHDFSMRLTSEKLMIEGTFMAVCPKADLEEGITPRWWVKSMRLTRAILVDPAQMGGPQKMGGRPPGS